MHDYESFSFFREGLEATYNSIRGGGGRGFNSLYRNVCIWGIGEMVALVVPSIASVFARSLPLIHVSALIFWMVILCWFHKIKYTMEDMRSLSG